MCGILGYHGNRNGTPIVHEGLKTLSYRGYDSWGIAASTQNGITIRKQTGDITKTKCELNKSQNVIGHTRWATHGEVNEQNAHPHTDEKGEISVVHNGIIENYAELRHELEQKGHKFKSNTDTEVIPHLIEENIKQGKTFEKAFEATLKILKGSYAILATHKNENSIMFARNGSPLILGIGDKEYFVSSDLTSFLQYTKTIVYLEEGDYGTVNSELKIYNKGKRVERLQTTANWNIETATKGEYPHYMLKEINEQPITIKKSLNQTNIAKAITALKNSTTVFLVGCGTSYNACAVSSYQFPKHAIPVLASEFEHKLPFVDAKTTIIAVSQSGETADVLDAVKQAKQKNAKIIAIVNVESSTLARTADVVLAMNCGPELSVVSTKCFTAQLAILSLLTSEMQGKETGYLHDAARVAKQLIAHTQVQNAVDKILGSENMFVIGRGEYSYLAKEAALKIKEISYMHAEGMAAGELKHGTIAVIEHGTPVMVIADSKTREQTISNAMEVKARGAFVIGIDSKQHPVYDVYIPIPEIEGATPILAILPVQLIAYYLAVEKDCDPDKPRNLAKSVTVR